MIRQTLTRFTRPAVLLFTGALLAVAGCRNDAPITGRADTFNKPWLTLGSDQLRSDTLIQEARPVRDANGILTVSVPVRNVTDLALHINYTYRFYDSRGLEVNRYPGVLNIPPRQTLEAVGNASGPQAAEFRLELSYPRIN
jgi:uncharacterized protein YcfL